MRPDSIRKFDLFYIAAIMIGIASALMNYDAQHDAVATQLAASGLESYADATLLGTLAVVYLVQLGLWFFVSRLRMGWAAWVIAILVAFSAATTLLTLVEGGLSLSISGLVTLLLKLIAVWHLYRPESRAWLKAVPE